MTEKTDLLETGFDPSDKIIVSYSEIDAFRQRSVSFQVVSCLRTGWAMVETTSVDVTSIEGYRFPYHQGVLVQLLDDGISRYEEV